MMGKNFPKHVEHVISAIKHKLTSSWFFFSTQIPEILYHASFRMNVNCLTVLDKSIIVFFKCKTLQINPAHHPYRLYPVVIYEQRRGGQSVSHSLINYKILILSFLIFIWFRVYTALILEKLRTHLHEKG